MPRFTISRRHAARLIGLAGLTLAAASPARADFLKPGDFTSLGSFAGSSSYDLDSTGLTLSSRDGTGVVYHGTVRDGVAVFAFDAFTLGAGGWIYGFGDRPIAILSRSDVVIEGLITATPTVPEGGPGGFDAGQGPGAAVSGPGSGGGGGYGGNGGVGGPLMLMSGQQVAASSPGGLAYGDLSQDLIGGSGGAAGSNISTSSPWAGAGGGALEIGALGSILVPGRIAASGGDGVHYGGGGAGGGVRLQATTIELSSGGVSIDAGGGAGAAALTIGGVGRYLGGGGGGGGRVMLVGESIVAPDGSINVSGGRGFQYGGDGEVVIRMFSVPEPSSFLLAAMAAGPGLIVRRMLRRRV